MPSLVELSADRIAEALSPQPSPTRAAWRWGTVEAVNEDGTMDVRVCGAVMPSVRMAASVADAAVGDRVRVSYLGTDALVDAALASGVSGPFIQCGSYSIPSGSGVSGTTYKDYQVAFESEFPSVPQVVACLAGGSTSGEMGNITLGVLTVTTTGFTARLWASGVETSRNPSIRYIATTL